MIVGEVAGTTLAETVEIRSLTVDVDSETFTISLRSQGMAGSVEVSQENVAGMGDVVILSRPFSCSLSMPTIHYDDSVPTSPVSQPQGQAMPRLRLSDFIRFQLLYHLRQKTKPLAEFGPLICSGGCLYDQEKHPPAAPNDRFRPLFYTARFVPQTEDTMSMKTRLKELEDRRTKSRAGGGSEKIEQQHSRGKLSARERIDLLVDPDSFVEIDRFVVHQTTDFGMAEKKIPGDGVVTGHATIDGRRIYLFSHDFTVFGGSLGEMFARKVCKIMDMALKTGYPVIGLNDSGGARIQEGVVSLGGYAEIFFRNVLASGVIPQLSAILGPCAGGAVYSPAMTDFTFMVDKTSHMFITGPDVIKAVLNQDVSFEDLGGARLHNTKSGVAHFFAKEEKECLQQVRRLLSYIPSNNREDPPAAASRPPMGKSEDLNSIIPEDPDKPYDMKEILMRVLDGGELLEVQPLYAANIITGFARLNGYAMGIVASQPKVEAGVIDINSSVKAARFIRFCDAFNVPILTFEDVPGFLPGIDQEHDGIIRHGSKLLYAYCEATVPKLTVITRKAYGGAYDVLGSKHVRADVNLAWPSAEIAVMGPEGAINIIFRNELSNSKDPEKTRLDLVQEYRSKFSNPYIAAEKGYLDDVIEPSETRPILIKYLEAVKTKREARPPRKHGNIPL